MPSCVICRRCSANVDAPHFNVVRQDRTARQFQDDLLRHLFAVIGFNLATQNHAVAVRRHLKVADLATESTLQSGNDSLNQFVLTRDFNPAIDPVRDLCGIQSLGRGTRTHICHVALPVRGRLKWVTVRRICGVVSSFNYRRHFVPIQSKRKTALEVTTVPYLCRVVGDIADGIVCAGKQSNCQKTHSIREQANCSTVPEGRLRPFGIKKSHDIRRKGVLRNWVEFECDISGDSRATVQQRRNPDGKMVLDGDFESGGGIPTLVPPNPFVSRGLLNHVLVHHRPFADGLRGPPDPVLPGGEPIREMIG